MPNENNYLPERELKQEKPIDIFVRNVFGSWRQLKEMVDKAKKDMPEIEVRSNEFVKQFIGNLKISRAEFPLCVQAIRKVSGKKRKDNEIDLAEERQRMIINDAAELEAERKKEASDLGIDPDEIV